MSLNGYQLVRYCARDTLPPDTQTGKITCTVIISFMHPICGKIQ